MSLTDRQIGARTPSLREQIAYDERLVWAQTLQGGAPTKEVPCACSTKPERSHRCVGRQNGLSVYSKGTSVDELTTARSRRSRRGDRAGHSRGVPRRVSQGNPGGAVGRVRAERARNVCGYGAHHRHPTLGEDPRLRDASSGCCRTIAGNNGTPPRRDRRTSVQPLPANASSAATPACAISESCSCAPVATPIAPTTFPSMVSGNPP